MNRIGPEAIQKEGLSKVVFIEYEKGTVVANKLINKIISRITGTVWEINDFFAWPFTSLSCDTKKIMIGTMKGANNTLK